MLKFFTLISFLAFYLSVSAQKAQFYQDKTVNLNSFNYFYMNFAGLDVHELTDPFFDRKSLDFKQMGYFIIYNELSLKNLVIIDDESDHATFLVNVYEGKTFNSETLTPAGYKPKKLNKNCLIIDLINGANKTLVWRGWIDLSKIKSTDSYQQQQKAIATILTNLKIEPVITD